MAGEHNPVGWWMDLMERFRLHTPDITMKRQLEDYIREQRAAEIAAQVAELQERAKFVQRYHERGRDGTAPR